MPVDDFARALVMAALNKPVETDTLPIWNIAPPNMQMTVLEAAERAASAGGVASPELGIMSPQDRRSYRVSGTLFQNAFPRFQYCDDFEGQVKATISAFKGVATLENDLREERFVRLAAFKQDRTSQLA